MKKQEEDDEQEEVDDQDEADEQEEEDGTRKVTPSELLGESPPSLSSIMEHATCRRTGLRNNRTSREAG